MRRTVLLLLAAIAVVILIVRSRNAAEVWHTADEGP